MRTYLLGATSVKILVMALEVYRVVLLRIAEFFISPYNTTQEVKNAIRREIEMVEGWIERLKPGHEFSYTSLSVEDKKFLRHVASQLSELVRLTQGRLSEVQPSTEFKEVDNLAKKVQELLEGPHLDVSSND